MGVVLPVAEARQVAVGAALPRVLCGGLAVHLEQSGSRAAQHAPDQVQVVDLDRRRGGLVGLVDALEDGGDQRVGGADQFGGLLDPGGRHVADARRPLGRAVGDPLGQLLEADGVRGDEVPVDPLVPDRLVQQGVEQRDVGAAARREVHGCVPGDLRGPGVHAQHARRIGPLQPVQQPHPLHGLGLGDVVAEQRDRVGVVEVVVAPGLSVAAEGLLQRLRRRRRAQPGVAVQVVGADAGPGQDRERVVLLQEQLTGRVEADRTRAPLLEQFA